MPGIVSELIEGNRALVGASWIIVIVVFLILGVVPAGTTDASAKVAIADVDLRQNVEPIGDQPLVEVEVAIILVQGSLPINELAALILQTPGRAVFQGVVPANTKVAITRVKLKRTSTQRDQT
ncbi:hypothetical protein D9M69_567910 [compost metagenome]